jgi:glutamate-ammonia-ligase adenylyltransferase
MDKVSLAAVLQNPAMTNTWLTEAGFRNMAASSSNLLQVAEIWNSQTRAVDLLGQLQNLLPEVSDPDMALNHLERYLSASNKTDSSPGGNDRAALLDEMISKDVAALPWMLMLFASSQYLADLLIHDLDAYPRVRATKGRRCTRAILDRQLAPSIDAAQTIDEATRVICHFKHQQTLRIAYGDLIVGHRVELVAEQISYLAESLCQGAFVWASRHLKAQWGRPLKRDGSESQYVILAMGKLGGRELNYSSDIDLVMIYEQDGNLQSPTTGNPSRTNDQYFEKLTQLIVKLLGDETPMGRAYRVDMRLRPHGSRSKICHSLRSVLRYYDLQGRTWERQALIKARPIAGDLKLGRGILRQLSHWIYRPNLSRTDISGIKALKRKIERRALLEGEDRTNIKTGRGGIRDIEFAIQFLQLLNGCLLKEVRGHNTFRAIKRLERADCLTVKEGNLLYHNYSWLRKLEHRLQIVHDLQTHTLPSGAKDLKVVARRMNYIDSNQQTALEQFQSDLEERTETNRSILNHLLHGAFSVPPGQGYETDGLSAKLHQDNVPPEVDLILDAYPGEVMIRETLSRYGFRDEMQTYQRLMELARESTPFLSARRCQHFFAAITPSLLQEACLMPDPDATLVALTTISDSLGAKGVLWELFSFNPPTLRLYIRMCALTDYLASILKQNPGMIDELMDALQLQQLPSRSWLEQNLKELSRGAEDLALVLHSFKNTQHMRIGVRDLLRRDDIRDIHRALSDVSSLCLESVAFHHYQKMIRRHAGEGKSDFLLNEFECPFVILGLGKLGGEEPNYHSDLDVIFLYDSSSGIEDHLAPEVTAPFFFSELAADITRFIAHSPSQGQLYEIDSRLRPTGKSGTLAVSFDEFERYFSSDTGQLWERQALCKARPVFGEQSITDKAMGLVRRLLTEKPWSADMAGSIRKMRSAMEADCEQTNLKRSVGGTIDIEFAIQMLQLKHARDDERVLVPGTIEAISNLVSAGFLDASVGDQLTERYSQLRRIEAQLRLMNTTARHDLPSDPGQLAKLAMLLEHSDSDEMLESIKNCRQTVREKFDRLFDAQ